MAARNLCVLGSTGSIGTQTLSIVESLGINITSISGYKNIDLLEEQALKFKPKYVCTADESSVRGLKIKLAHTGCKVVGGSGALEEIVSTDGSDTVLTSVVGIAGLRPTVAAIKAKKDIALANKETLVAAGGLITDLVSENKVRLLPVDSEHSAIFQCLQDTASAKRLKKIFLTASGGPFFGKDAEFLKTVSLADALNHPNWSMGKKITIDSATMMNKGLELIEAMWLFGLQPENIEIAVHRQSIVHSMVEFDDSSVLAQLGVPDMRIPIQYALTYPDRKQNAVEPLTIERMAKLTFERADEETFVCIAACKKAAAAGGIVPCIANAANEKAVELYLAGKIGFLNIGEAVMNAVNLAPNVQQYQLEDLFEIDSETRTKTAEFLHNTIR
ncbi:MAG: 1-deoxy-D-xylulose-5-phosphate reductoisomerase [Oscillospiraceae bacterium]